MSRDRLTPDPDEIVETVDEDRPGGAPLTLVSSSRSIDAVPAHRRVATGTYSPLETSPYEEPRVDSSQASVVFRMSLVAVLLTVFGAFVGGIATTIIIERFTGVNPAMAPVATTVLAPTPAAVPAPPPAVAPPAAIPAPVAERAPAAAAPTATARTRAARAAAPVAAEPQAEPAEAQAEPKPKRAKPQAKAAEQFPDPFAE